MGQRTPTPISTRLASYVVRNPLIYAYTGVLGTMSLASSFFDKPGRIQHGFARLWSKLILQTSSCPLEVTGLEKIPSDTPAVYCANHISAFDIPVLYYGLPFQFRIMAKQELFRYPFLGWHLRRSGQIPIDRGDARASLRSLSAASTTVRSGMPMVAFPEGGRSEDGHLQPFLGGVFYVAIKAQVPVVPMAIVGTLDALPMNTYTITPTPLRLIIGDPIPTTGITTREMDTLAERVKQAIAELYYSNANIEAPVL